MLPSLSLFPNEWVTFAVFLAGILLLIGLSEVAQSRLRWSPEASRKFVHVLVGVLVLISPFLFESNRPPIVLSIIFIVLNAAALKSERFAALYTTNRKSFGTVYFPVAYLILSLFWWGRPIVFEVSLLLLAFADTAAAVVGQGAKSPEIYVVWRDHKTIQGSVTMFLFSTALIGMGTTFFHDLSGTPPPALHILIPLSLFVGGLATIGESISSGGSDNLSVPLVTAVSYDLFLASASSGEVLLLLAWVLFSFTLALGAFRLNSLGTDGALGAFILGIFVFGIGRWKFMVPLGIFFVVSSLLSKIGKNRKEETRRAFGKGSKRDMVQVFANGGIPMLVTIWWFYQPSEWLYAAYLASVAAAAADTWATEIGLFSRSAPFDSVTFRRVEPGTSGGITPLGTVAALLGSVVIAASALPFVADQSVMKWIILAGFAASMIDSVLGATVQALYKCDGCGKATELPTHCNGRSTTLTKGSRYISNDLVNLLCGLSGGTILLLAG